MFKEGSLDELQTEMATELMIVKFAHEFQHKATYIFSCLRRDLSNPSPRLITMPEQNSPPATPAPHERQGDTIAESPLQGEHRPEFNTPERVGSIIVHGVVRGDSGYGLEEVLLGGRLRHSRRHNQASFEVC